MGALYLTVCLGVTDSAGFRKIFMNTHHTLYDAIPQLILRI